MIISQLTTRILKLNSSRIQILSSLLSTEISSSRIRQAYYVFGLDETASIDEIKERFAKLARMYHPDTGGKTANPGKFFEIRNCFKLILKSKDDINKKDEEIENETKDIERDIVHTAPQHRQYLEYGGRGYGTPSERQKQYQQFRVYNAVEKAADFMLEKALNQAESAKALQLQKEKLYFSKKHKLTGMIDRVVEEMILSSMGSGEFSNLKGSGKPMKEDFSNPYIDESEKRINNILKNNGFQPAWLLKQSDIITDVKFIRKRLREEYCRFSLLSNKEYSLTTISKNREERYERIKNEIKVKINQINKNIQDFNLINPIMIRQMILLNFDKELKESEEFIESNTEESLKFIDDVKVKIKNEIRTTKSSNNESLWGFIKASF